jgi:23S rRNA (adenine2503-C2)-methyltransferase
MSCNSVLPHSPGTPPINLLTLDQESVEELVLNLGWPRFRAQQILRWLYRHRARDVEQMTDLSISQRAQLAIIARVGRLGGCQIFTSADGTSKFLARLDDGLVVESVLIPDGQRLTLCVSTQVGCTLDCGFCLTGTMGLKRNLKAHEIVDQVLTAQDHLKPNQILTNLVLMGMGEPLANFEAVSEALTRLTNSTWGLGIAGRRTTLSTAGLAPRLNDAAALGVNLAISLNATTDALRDRLMPAINHLYPLKALLSACRNLDLPPRQRLTFEYVLLDGVNDSVADAKRLTKLVAGIRCKVNLIPFNDFPGSPFRRPTQSAVSTFQSTLRGAGLDVFLRKSMGRDVLGACGQLGTFPTRQDATALFPVGTNR